MTEKISTMELSLILSTRNNAESLRTFLNALNVCKKPRNWEVIVVDNGSTDNTQRVIRLFEHALPLKYLFQPVPGKSRSLNYGLREVRGEVVLFTDDDVIPDEYWLVNHLEVMGRRADIDAVGGSIIIDESLTPDWLARSYNLKGILISAHDLGDTITYCDTDKYPFGPNMAVRKRVLNSCLAPWPENLGPGTNIPVGDEAVFFKNIFGNDKSRILYDPACLVKHEFRGGRLSFLRSVNRCFKGGYVAALYLDKAMARRDNLSMNKVALLRHINSIPELICVVSRFAGFLLGRLKVSIGLTDHSVYMENIKRGGD